MEMQSLATVFSMQSLTRSAANALQKGPDHLFSRDEILSIREIARARPPKEIEADDKFIRQSLASLAAVTRQQEQDLFGGTLKLNGYRHAIRGASRERIEHAYCVCRDQSEFFPSIPALKAALRSYQSPEEKMIAKARWVLEFGNREKPRASPLSQDEIDALSPEHLRMGLALGEVIERDGKYFAAPIDTRAADKKENDDE